MNPVFKEYIQFLKDKGLDYPLEEGYYWLDKQIIKCYDNKGDIHKILRLKIDDELNITYKYYDNINTSNSLIKESWQDTVIRNKNKLNKLEKESFQLITNSIGKYENYEPIIFTSGGKDSNMVTYLVRERERESKCIFNNTSLDCADTYLYIKNLKNCTILNPEEGFYIWVKRIGFTPTRFSRGCCRIYKEEKTINYFDEHKKYLFFYGMRNDESTTRSIYKDERYDTSWGKREWMGILPIRKWTEEEIWLYTFYKNIPINPKYKKGYMRAGCAIACPFTTKTTWILDKYWYPKMYNRWHKILEEDFKNKYLWIVINCTLQEYHSCWNGGTLRKIPTNEVITEFAEYKNLDEDIALKYFNHTCKICDKKVHKKDDIAMNMKLLGRNIKEYYCKKHLMEFLKFDKIQWDTYIKEFKESGCSLF